MEEPARRAFENGNVAFMRNWSYAYSLNQKAPKLKGNFEVSPLPPWEGGKRAGILGGNGPFISAYSENPKGALLFVDHLSSPETLERNMAVYSLPSVLKATYDEPEIQQKIPYSAELEKAIEQANPRPVSPVYNQISQAIYKNVNAALAGADQPRRRARAGRRRDQQGARHVLMVSLLMVGAGARGTTFADWARRHPSDARVVAVADPRAVRRDRLGDVHGVPSGRRFAGWREAAEAGRVADAAVIATLDRDHLEPALALGGAGLRAADREAARAERGGVRDDRGGVRARRGRRGGRARAPLHAVHAARSGGCWRPGRPARSSTSSISSRSASGTRRTRTSAATGAARTRPARCCSPSAATTSTGSRTSSDGPARRCRRSAR